MSEEIRPCPWCGGTNMSFCHAPDSWYVCLSCGVDGPMATDAKAKWNSAWCWKEIDRLKADNEKLHVEASKGWYTPTKEAEIKLLKKQNQELVDLIGGLKRILLDGNQIMADMEKEHSQVKEQNRKIREALEYVFNNKRIPELENTLLNKVSQALSQYRKEE